MYEEVKAKTFSFGSVGDGFEGTLLDITKTTSADKYGKFSNIYKVKIKEGSFHDSTKNEKTGKFTINEEPTVITPGEEYTMWVNHDKGVLIGAMKDIRLGQMFKVTFTETKPTDKGNDAKIIKVFAGKDKQGLPLMDEAWLASQSTNIYDEDNSKME